MFKLTVPIACPPINGMWLCTIHEYVILKIKKVLESTKTSIRYFMTMSWFVLRHILISPISKNIKTARQSLLEHDQIFNQKSFNESCSDITSRFGRVFLLNNYFWDFNLYLFSFIRYNFFLVYLFLFTFNYYIVIILSCLFFKNWIINGL